MKITPLEIRQKSFEKVFRGYDKDEVSAYLQSLSQEWERVVEESKELKFKVETLQNEVSKLREVENSLFKTLKTAEDTGATLIEQAKKETEIHIKQSRLKADEIINVSKEKARKMVENAEGKTKRILDEMINHVKTLESHYNQVHDFREKIIAQLKIYASEVAERNEKFEERSKDPDISEILYQARKTYNDSMLDIEAITKEEDEFLASDIAVETVIETEAQEQSFKEVKEEEIEKVVGEVEQSVPEEKKEDKEEAEPEEIVEKSVEPEHEVEFEIENEEIIAEAPDLNQPPEPEKKEKTSSKSFFDEIE